MKRILSIIVTSLALSSYTMERQPAVLEKQDPINEIYAVLDKEWLELTQRKCTEIKQLLAKAPTLTALSAVLDDKEIDKESVTGSHYLDLVGTIYYECLCEYFAWIKHSALPDKAEIAKIYAQKAYKVLSDSQPSHALIASYEAFSTGQSMGSTNVGSEENSAAARKQAHSKEGKSLHQSIADQCAELEDFCAEKKKVLSAIAVESIKMLEDLHAKLIECDLASYTHIVRNELIKDVLHAIYPAFFKGHLAWIEADRQFSAPEAVGYFIMVATMMLGQIEEYWQVSKEEWRKGKNGY